MSGTQKRLLMYKIFIFTHGTIKITRVTSVSHRTIIKSSTIVSNKEKINWCFCMIYYPRLLFIWISAILCNLNYSKLYEKQPRVCNIMLKLRMKKLRHMNFTTHVNFKGLLKSVGENIPLFQYFHRAQENESERSILIHFLRVFPILALARTRGKLIRTLVRA